MFDTRTASAYDRNRKVEIHYPRLEPGEGEDEIELQFPIYLDGKRIYGIACFGVVTELDDGPELWKYGFWRKSQIESLLLVKPWIAEDLSDRDFIDYLSDGLTAVLASGYNTIITTIYCFSLSSEVYFFLGGTRNASEANKTFRLDRRVVNLCSDAT